MNFSALVRQGITSFGTNYPATLGQFNQTCLIILACVSPVRQLFKELVGSFGQAISQETECFPDKSTHAIRLPSSTVRIVSESVQISTILKDAHDSQSIRCGGAAPRMDQTPAARWCGAFQTQIG